MNPHVRRAFDESRALRSEVRHHLGVCRKAGVYAYPDPDQRSIILRGPGGPIGLDEWSDAEVVASIAWLQAHDGEVHDYLVSLLTICRNVQSDSAAGEEVSSGSHGVGSSEGASATRAPATTPAANPDRAPSIPCPACDDLSPCDDHRLSEEQEVSAKVAALCFLGLLLIGVVAAVIQWVGGK